MEKFSLSKNTNRSNIDLSHQHLTTLDFGQIVPFLSMPVLPGDKFNIDYSVFCRTAPFVYPAYLNANIKCVCAYVPYYQVFDNAEAFFQGMDSVHGNSTTIPILALDTLQSTLTKHKFLSTATDSDYDFIASWGSKYKFNYFGKFIYKILKSLGYELYQPQKNNNNYTSQIKLNALPLLCLAKLYHDWFSNQQYYQFAELGDVINEIKVNGGPINSDQLNTIFDSFKLMYDDDYITNAWRYSNSALQSYSAGKTINVPTSAGTRSIISTDADNFVPVSGSATTLSASQIRFLNSLDNFIRRNNYSGTRPAIRALARFGIKTEDYKANYSDIINVKTIPLQIGDVTQTSETADSPLGSYAGKGILNGGDNAKVNVSDYGHIFILGYISVKNLYKHFFDREVLKSDYTEFYVPEFDGVGVDAISFDEVVSDPKFNNANDEYTDYTGNQVYGFTEHYNDYRQKRSFVTGDFLIDDTFNEWFVYRDFSNYRANRLKAQSDNYVYYPNTSSSPYTKLFAVADTDQYSHDHFFLSCNFKINANRPIKNLSEAINLGDGDLEFSKNGNTQN